MLLLLYGSSLEELQHMGIHHDILDQGLRFLLILAFGYAAWTFIGDPPPSLRKGTCKVNSGSFKCDGDKLIASPTRAGSIPTDGYCHTIFELDSSHNVNHTCTPSLLCKACKQANRKFVNDKKLRLRVSFQCMEDGAEPAPRPNCTERPKKPRRKKTDAFRRNKSKNKLLMLR